MNWWDNFKLSFWGKIDKLVWKHKHKIVTKCGNRLDKRYGIKQIGPWNCDDRRYNRYEGVNPFAIDDMIKANVFTKDDYFVDVGCGHGRLLMFLAEHGYKHLVGIEYDHLLFDMCKDNILRNIKMYPSAQIELFHERAEQLSIPAKWNVFYIFNSFRYKEIYIDFLNRIKESVNTDYRKIILIVLFPTESSIAAFSDDPWLKSRKKIYDCRQPCYRCTYFYIFSNEKNAFV